MVKPYTSVRILFAYNEDSNVLLHISRHKNKKIIKNELIMENYNTPTDKLFSLEMFLFTDKSFTPLSAHLQTTKINALDKYKLNVMQGINREGYVAKLDMRLEFKIAKDYEDTFIFEDIKYNIENVRREKYNLTFKGVKEHERMKEKEKLNVYKDNDKYVVECKNVCVFSDKTDRKILLKTLRTAELD